METKERLGVVGTFTMTESMLKKLDARVTELNGARPSGYKRITKADVIRDALERYLSDKAKGK